MIRLIIVGLVALGLLAQNNQITLEAGPPSGVWKW